MINSNLACQSPQGWTRMLYVSPLADHLPSCNGRWTRWRTLSFCPWPFSTKHSPTISNKKWLRNTIWTLDFHQELKCQSRNQQHNKDDWIKGAVCGTDIYLQNLSFTDISSQNLPDSISRIVEIILSTILARASLWKLL